MSLSEAMFLSFNPSGGGVYGDPDPHSADGNEVYTHGSPQTNV